MRQTFVWIVILLCLSPSLSSGQAGINNLVFNSTEQIIGLNFSSSEAPALFYTGKRANATIGEGIAHAENQEGEIIFWVNSSGIYDRDNNLMPGAIGILAHPSSTEIIISPFPGEPSKYYIFYNNQLCSTLYFSVVNIELREGLGDVEQLNVAITPNKSFAEGLEVVRIPCSENYWLIANECGRGLTRFQVTDAGISAGILFLANTYNTGGRGELDFHKGKLGYAITYHPQALVTDFNALTGDASNSSFLPLPLQNGAYGLEFSPDATKMYVTDLSNRDIFGNPTGNNLYAFDLHTGTGQGWQIRNNNTSCSSQLEGLGHIEQGKDGKLYISQIGGCEIVVIEDANTATPAITKINVATVLSAGISDHIQSDFLDEDLLQQASIVSEGPPFMCTDESIILTAIVDSPENKEFQWYWNSEPILDATHATYAASMAGAYTAHVSNSYGCELVTAPLVVTDQRIPEIAYQKRYESCGREAVTLRYQAEGYQAVWFDGTTGDTKEVTSSGHYEVTVSNGYCSKTNVIEVEIQPQVHYFIPNVITPNGDSKNDYFIINELQEPVQLYVYSRWGVLLFHSENYQNDWQGNKLPNGTYYYRFVPVNECGQEQKGWVQILRGNAP